MNKRNIILLICAAMLAIGCVLLVLWKTKVIFNKSDIQVDMFAVKDTATVTRVFLADMHENTVLLTKTAEGWRVSDTVPVIAGKIESLLSTMQNLRVQQPASKNSIDNINRMMAAGAIKVEIYENAPLFTLFKKGFFVKERRTLTYYTGPATQSNTSNYAILEGREEMPCIYGDYQLLYCNDDVLVFSRSYMGETYIVGINKGAKAFDMEGWHIEPYSYTIKKNEIE